MKGLNHNMDNQKIENDSPLLVIKYKWWRKLYTYIAYLIGILVGIMGYFSFFLSSSFLGWLFTFMLMMMGLFGFYGVLELLLFKELRFYKDRVEKCFYLVGKKQLYFQHKGLIRNGSFFDFFIFVSQKKRFEFLFIPIYLIGTGKDYLEMIKVLALISGRRIQEIEDVSLYGENLKYFLLSEAQNISSEQRDII